MKHTMLFALLCSAVSLSSVSASAVEVGDHAPCVELRDLQPSGETLEQCIRTRPEEKKYLLIEFFTTSCGDCARNLPKLSKLADEISATTTTRLVGIDRDENALRFYIEQHHDLIHFPVAFDTARSAKTAYGVRAVPTMFLLDGDNNVIYRFDDVLTEQQSAVIQSLVSH
jgi:peroxiredoxin